MAANRHKRVLVAGGTTVLGLHIASALVAANLEVTLLVREGTEHRLGALANLVQWHIADVWDTASLKGRARGQGTVIHTVGSMVADPEQGLTYHRLNVVPARNVASMCVSDGVPHMIFLSAARSSGVKRPYLRTKREAESTITRMGIQVSIVRAPMVYLPGQDVSMTVRLSAFLGRTPPISWFGFGRRGALPMNVLSGAIAQIAEIPQPRTRIYYAPELRRMVRQAPQITPVTASIPEVDVKRQTLPFEPLDEESTRKARGPKEYL